MKTFILLTFGFLGFAFYEMSGGSEFQPASARMAQAAPEAVTESPAVQEATVQKTAIQPADVIETASIAKMSDTQDVTRVALNLTTVSEAGAGAAATPPAIEMTGARVIDSSETPQIILPSLIATTGTSSGPIDTDIRSVSGNRVNVRGGPSTNYGIVSKLERGTEVRILEDNGNGWVRMQPLDGGEAGWMADFLLTSG